MTFWVIFTTEGKKNLSASIVKDDWKCREDLSVVMPSPYHML
jgi:hypothetical protein